jgi:hypothetical protein
MHIGAGVHRTHPDRPLARVALLKLLRGRLLIVSLLAVVALCLPLAAQSATTYNDSIVGGEYSATSTEGKFFGAATGGLPGTWNAVVDHTPLSLSSTPTATITGGYVTLTTVIGFAATVVRGDFTSGGIVQVQNRGTDCTNQTFRVVGALKNVGTASGASGTGLFDAILTHYRARVFGICVTYSASVSGSLSLSF